MGVSERRKREREQRKKEILDAAETLFFARPYDAVSMDDIARAIELSKATLYLYFRDKETLYSAIVERGLRIWHDMISESVRDADSGIDQLAAIGFTNRRFVETHPDHYKAYNVFRSGRFTVERKTDTEEIEAIQQILQAFSAITDSAIKAGIDDGTLRSDVNPAVLSVLLMTFADSVNNLHPRLREKLRAQGITDDQFVKEFIDLMYNMMENPDRTVPRRTLPKTGD